MTAEQVNASSSITHSADAITQSVDDSPPQRNPTHNERGVIAETYYELQGLALLDEIRARAPLPKASPLSLHRALFQAVEIALLNLNDVSQRAIADIEEKRFGDAVSKLFWARDFHRILLNLGTMPERLGAAAPGRQNGHFVCFRDSPALIKYAATVKALDQQINTIIQAGEFDIEAILGSDSLDDIHHNIIHLMRIGYHEMTLWESYLSYVPTPDAVPDYSSFISADRIYDCVFNTTLKGDTFFTQFRALHQIPETLGEEANDQCESAISDIRRGELYSGLERLQCATALMDAMVTMITPMADNLTTSEYHKIRENLGLTSGSHSVCLHYHMFSDLHAGISDEIINIVTRNNAPDEDNGSIASAVSRISKDRNSNAQSWIRHQLVSECIKMQSCIFRWRDLHLHFPRNNLGGNLTKSLSGSSDGLRAAAKMRDVARQKNPMNPLLSARGFNEDRHQPMTGLLGRYIESEGSVDTLLLFRTGAVTQNRFHEVQNRLGFFANRCPFKAPPRRTG